MLLIAILHEVLWPNSDNHMTIFIGRGLNHCYSLLLLNLAFLSCLVDSINISLEVLAAVALSWAEVVMPKGTGGCLISN